MKIIVIWWAALLLPGAANLPLTHLIFQSFKDRGWLFSKTLGLFLTAWLLWVGNVCGVLSFTQSGAFIALTVLCVLNYGGAAAVTFLTRIRRDGSNTETLSFSGEEGDAKYFSPDPPARQTVLQSDPGTVPDSAEASPRRRLPAGAGIILFEEALFFLLFAAAVYVIGFKPEAYGTEKFMDYSFLTSMMRSLSMPFQDPWYAGEAVNYYYGGQYTAALLIKFTGVTAGEGYNLMRALITAFSFALPFSLVFQLLRDRLEADIKKPARTSLPALLGGLLGGTAVAFCGNGHYVIFGILLPLINKAKGLYYSYWFPDSTRYIGYNPDLPDKTIHEFPAYSSVLGDLHAHYINILFVLTVTAIVYAWAKKGARAYRVPPCLHPEILLIGLMTGVFRWTNYWDFPIYFVVCGSIFFFVLLQTFRDRPGAFLLHILSIAAVMFGVGYAASLPFTLSFVKISSEIGLTHSHSRFDQLLVLWALPAACLTGFVIRLAAKRKKPELPDLSVLLFGLCAAGLVLLPELIYVKDIYGESHYRANTMFKLTYQAFILFGIVMSYVLVRAVTCAKKLWRCLGVIGLVLLLLTSGYIGQSVSSWFGNVLIPGNRIHTDASVFISEYFPSDFEAINYLNANVGGQPVVLEAPGDSYSDYERVSVATGLPTIAGWYVHEWLWRENLPELNERIQDCGTIYTSWDQTEAQQLIDKYRISYIYVGRLEREKYPDLNESLLRDLGEIVFENDETFIVKTNYLE